MQNQLKRERMYEAGTGVFEKITLDFNPGPIPNLQDILVSSQIMSSGSSLAVVVETSNCTGIVGSITVKQAMEKSGAPSFGFAAPQTLALAVTGSASVGMTSTIDFMGAVAVLDASAITWPTAGRMVIWIIAKR
jgi:hypothetical protein